MLSLDKLIPVDDIKNSNDIELLRNVAVWYREAFGKMLPNHHKLKAKMKEKNKQIDSLFIQLKELKNGKKHTHRMSDKAREMILKDRQRNYSVR